MSSTLKPLALRSSLPPHQGEIKHTKILIIGAGPAGYTAAIYAARAGHQPLLVQGLQPGGQLMITTEVENYPGFREAIQGPFLMEEMRAQAEHVGTNFAEDLITHVDFSARPYLAFGDSGILYVAETIIIATGAKARWLGIESEQRYQGFGVSACATCDGFFFRGKKVAVIGGGNSAVEEALFLANMTAEVVLIHRRDELRAEKILQQRLKAKNNVSFIWHAQVDEILGKTDPTPQVTGLRLKDLRHGNLSDIAVDGIFVAIGHDPATQPFATQLAMDEGGYIITSPDSTATNIPGVFAAGDVKDKIYRQAITAAGMGCMAALEADKYLAVLE
ncbi:MAG: thioredoxin-disulfide reductase [Alphaproteobacteria bacterium]